MGENPKNIAVRINSRFIWTSKRGYPAGLISKDSLNLTGRQDVLRPQKGGADDVWTARPAEGSRSGFIHQVDESVEKVVCVVRSGGGLGVILDAEQGEFLVFEAFESSIVEVDVGEGDVVSVE